MLLLVYHYSIFVFLWDIFSFPDVRAEMLDNLLFTLYVLDFIMIEQPLVIKLNLISKKGKKKTNVDQINMSC